MADEIVELIDVPAVKSVFFPELNPDLQQSVILFLCGSEAALFAQVTAWARRLVHDERLWQDLLRREFPESMTASHAEAECGGIQRYRSFTSMRQCRAIRWSRLQCRHQLGSREGSPGMFACRGFLFVFGGWGYGPECDLHAARLEDGGETTAMTTFREVRLAGRGPTPSYEMKVTVLDDERSAMGSFASPSCNASLSPVRVAITGGYRMGGYHGELGQYSILEISFPEGSLPTGRWAAIGPMTPRSNHTATFVPPESARAGMYPHGMLLVFGGNVRGQVVNSIDVLDLESMAWTVGHPSEGPAPSPRNSHTATLVATARGDQILVAGGGTGDGTNGGPPRGGEDMDDAFWLDPSNFRWEHAQGVVARGRGHNAFRLGTTVVLQGGGYVPTAMASSVSNGGRRVVDQVEVLSNMTAGSLPQPRAFGGACTLPDGTLVMYGGWHPLLGTFSDVWVGHVDGVPSGFCAGLPRSRPGVIDLFGGGSMGPFSCVYNILMLLRKFLGILFAACWWCLARRRS